MPSRPMFTTPARSDHRPPSPAMAMGTAEIRAARNVPSDVTPSASATMRTVESATSPMETYSHIREGGAPARL